jgi:parvulin-like peptidyl-prolyl isomerase
VLAGCGEGTKKVAAKVNNDIITEEEYLNRLQEVDAVALGSSAQQGGPAKAGEYAMRAIITEKLINQLAAAKGAKPDDAQIAQILEFSKRFPSAPGALGINPLKSEADTRRDAALELCVRNLALKPLNIKPEDISKLYESVKGQLVEPESVRLRIVDLATKAKAEEALASLTKGVSFETVAMTKSEDPASRSRNGDVGFRPLLALPEPLRNAVKSLKPGEFTKTPVKTEVAVNSPAGVGAGATPGGVRYLLAQVVERKPERTAKPEEVKPLLETLLLQQKDPNANNRVREMMKETVSKADIQVNIKGLEKVPAAIKAAMSAQPAAAPAAGSGMPTTPEPGAAPKP